MPVLCSSTNQFHRQIVVGIRILYLIQNMVFCDNYRIGGGWNGYRTIESCHISRYVLSFTWYDSLCIFSWLIRQDKVMVIQTLIIPGEEANDIY